jgi:hypothetical protein
MSETYEYVEYDRRSTAYHEAAHAVLHALAGIKVTTVTAIPSSDGTTSGRTCFEDRNLTPENCDGYLKGLVAGDLAQHKIKTKAESLLSSGDEEILKILISHPAWEGPRTSDEVRKIYMPQAQADLDDPEIWSVIETIADRLQQAEFVTGDEIIVCLQTMIRVKHEKPRPNVPRKSISLRCPMMPLPPNGLPKIAPGSSYRKGKRKK